MATIAFKSGAFTGAVDVGQGQVIRFSGGSATVSELEDRAATLPRGGRLRRICDHLDAQFGSGTYTIDGVEPDSFFRANYGYGRADHY